MGCEDWGAGSGGLTWVAGCARGQCEPAGSHTSREGGEQDVSNLSSWVMQVSPGSREHHGSPGGTSGGLPHPTPHLPCCLPISTSNPQSCGPTPPHSHLPVHLCLTRHALNNIPHMPMPHPSCPPFLTPPPSPPCPHARAHPSPWHAAQVFLVDGCSC